MVLLLAWKKSSWRKCFGTMSFQMVLLLARRQAMFAGMFWNYVIPDGSTTLKLRHLKIAPFWNYVIPDGSTTRRHNAVSPEGFGTMSFQMVLLHIAAVLLCADGFGTMSFQMVLLPQVPADIQARVLELCHSRWFYYAEFLRARIDKVLELCHSRWFYYRNHVGDCQGFVLELCHSRWFYYFVQM